MSPILSFISHKTEYFIFVCFQTLNIGSVDRPDRTSSAPPNIGSIMRDAWDASADMPNIPSNGTTSRRSLCIRKNPSPSASMGAPPGASLGGPPSVTSSAAAAGGLTVAPQQVLVQCNHTCTCEIIALLLNVNKM